MFALLILWKLPICTSKLMQRLNIALLVVKFLLENIMQENDIKTGNGYILKQEIERRLLYSLYTMYMTQNLMMTFVVHNFSL